MDTIVSLIDDSCRRCGNRVALRQKRNEIWREVSYRDLSATSDGIAGGLLTRGFNPGHHAALLAPSSPQWVMTYLGILKAGGVVVPIDRELKSIELLHILKHSDAEVLFTSVTLLTTVMALAGALPNLRQIVTIDGPPPPGAAALALREMEDHTQPASVPIHPEDMAVILYTSGTTGRAKGAMLSHANIASNIRGAIHHLGLDSSIHTLSFLPINHVFEQVCGILLPLTLGGRVSFAESLKKLGDNLIEVRPTFLVGVPAFYRMILDRIRKKITASPLSRLLFTLPPTRSLVRTKVRKQLGSGTIFISGGAALDPAVAKGLGKLGVTIFQGYGITETAPVIAAEGPDAARPGTVGRTLPGVEVRIENPGEDGVGEIVVKGPNVMRGYYKDTEATAEILKAGWYSTGDLGRLDKNGFLSVCGRVKNLIVTPNGRNVYPEEVEHEILKSRYIAEAVVHAHRSGDVIEEIHAMIYPNWETLEELAERKGLSSLPHDDVEKILRREVDTACNNLAAYKRVKKITIRQDEFPKTTTRKIKRFALEHAPTSTSTHNVQAIST